MAELGANPIDHLLPVPKRITHGTGFLRLSPDAAIRVRVDDPRIERAAEVLVTRAKQSLTPPHPEAGRTRPNPVMQAAALEISVDPSVASSLDGYRLDVHEGVVRVTGGSPRGCFCGLTTLGELMELGGGVMPCRRIDDRPDFATRGVLLDISRGRVPTLSTLKMTVERLARLKVNQIQLSIEHAFVFPFDPDICDAGSGLTPDEVRELDAFCRARFIDLVPALATFGHMGRVLSMPKYRHLAEVEATTRWEDQPWPVRARGLTLDVTNPESHRLVECLWGDVLDAFSSPVVNLCGDEPWDLGRGKNRDRPPEEMFDQYVRQVRRVCEQCTARGRRVQMWSDVLNAHDRRLEGVPRDVTILHWGYDENADLDGTGRFVDQGFDTFVCPGTSGWKRIINGMSIAERNIAASASAGKTQGAGGLLTTDWGDHGHFHPPACSWHGLALGASLAWRADHPTGEAFDRRFARSFQKCHDAAGVEHLRRAAVLGDVCETWRLMWTSPGEVATDPTLPDQASCDRSSEAASALAKWADDATPRGRDAAQDLEELRIAARFTARFVEKVALVRAARDRTADRRALRDRCETWADSLTLDAERYAPVWNARNKPSGLADIRAALDRAADDMRAYLS